MKFFYCSTCFECYYIHPLELTTVCGCTALFWCVLVYWCGSAGVGWYPSAGWSTTGLCMSIYSTSKMMHGPINIRFITIFITSLSLCLLPSQINLFTQPHPIHLKPILTLMSHACLVQYVILSLPVVFNLYHPHCKQ